MKRLDAIKYISDTVSAETRIVYCNGRTAREGFFVKDREHNFYMLAAMGHAASTGMGMATMDKFPVVVVDGDGNLLMNFNVLPAIGHADIRNFIHIVFDNHAYETTGSQSTILADTPLDEVAKKCGYEQVFKVDSLGQFNKCFNQAYASGKKSFIWASIMKNSDDPTSIIPRQPTEIKKRCMK